ncbi:MAG: phosphoglycerate dehydrogenase [Mobilitalea sp.]
MSKERSLVILSRSFAKASDLPLNYLKEHGVDYRLVRNNAPEDIEYIIEQIGSARAIIVGSDIINRQVMDACPNLEIISKHGVGLDSIDLDYAKSKGITVTKTPDANNESVADLTLLFMLYLLRNLSNTILKESSPDWKAPKLSHDLFQNTVGLIGLGKIGMAVAKRLSGFRCRILAYDPYLKEVPDVENCFMVDMDTLLKESNIVSLHMPLTNGTREFMNREKIDKLKKGAFLINTSRGALVDEAALYQALITNHLGGVGLDVFTVEPPVNNPLIGLDNVVCTPHIAPHTEEANMRMGMAASENVVQYFIKTNC